MEIAYLHAVDSISALSGMTLRTIVSEGIKVKTQDNIFDEKFIVFSAKLPLRNCRIVEMSKCR